MLEKTLAFIFKVLIWLLSIVIIMAGILNLKIADDRITMVCILISWTVVTYLFFFMDTYKWKQRLKRKNKSSYYIPTQPLNTPISSPQQTVNPTSYLEANSIYIDDLPEEFVVLDFETTGLSPLKNKILEIGAIKVNNTSGSLYEYHTLIEPKNNVPAKITAITGITTDQAIKYGKPIEKAIHELINFIGDSPIAAYNAKFDMAFLMSTCKMHGLRFNNDYFCILEIAKEAFPDLPNHKLNTVSRMLEVEDSQNHRALDDAKLALKVLILSHKKLSD